MKWPWLAVLPVLLAPSGALAAPAIRGVFVGIDKYLYSRSRPAYPDADFGDLRGAVSDAQAIKQALSIAYRLQFDTAVAGKCVTTNAISITLTDTCATRQQILSALTNQIAASAAHDTVIFYFAGHGSTITDDQVFDQASGADSTILPTDARDPNAIAAADIVDREIRRIIDIANARGVNVVTIFDSCNSGTAARGESGDGENRGVDGVVIKHHADFQPMLRPIGPGGGYRVHFGASRDNEEAREVVSGANVHGVFTTAFAQALVARPDATFGDIATAVRLKVDQGGHKSQHPQAEGELRARFGGEAIRTALFDAQAQGGGITLAAGRLLGMTVGSKFALFANQADALNDAAVPLALATITSITDGQAQLTLDAQPGRPLPPMPIARETAHAFGDDRLKVSVSEAIQPGPSRLVGALTALGFVEVVAEGSLAQLNLLRRGATDEVPVLLFTGDGTGLASLGAVTEPDFAQQLRLALLPVYKERRLVSLASKSSAEVGIVLCLSTKLDHPTQVCPELVNRQRKVPVDTPLALTVTNASNIARYVYVLVIDDRYGITQLIPTGHGKDPPMPAGAAQRPGPFALNTTGLYRFVVITTDAPINASLLEQAPLRHRMSGPCEADVEARGVCTNGAGGARDGGIPALGDWTITIEDALVVRERSPQ